MEVVPMEEGGYDMATVERKGKFWGYMGNEGPVKVSLRVVLRGFKGGRL
jgi:hypothetical protein